MTSRKLNLGSLIVLVVMTLGCGRDPSLNDLEAASLLPKNTRQVEVSKFEFDWQKAIEPREFKFPKDHGSHDDFRIEWWYYTGNLVSKEGKRFGYQLTFFRTGIQRGSANQSRWVLNDLYTVHFAVSDIRNKKHYSAQQNRRAGVGLAGAASDKLQVWNGDCRIEEQDGFHILIANEDEFGIDLKLATGKGIVLQGDQGLSKKGAAKGNASYYYSMPRMPTEGSVLVNGEVFKVTGDSWMDHEFSTSFLEEGQRGWDWLSLQMDDGSELMLYQMRRTDGTKDPHSSGTLISSDGQHTELTSEDFRLMAGKTWRSPSTGAKYPLHWDVEVKPLGLKFTVKPTFDPQEMLTEATTGIAYWEGAIEVNGSRNKQPISGRGYLELTGYTETELGSMIKN